MSSYIYRPLDVRKKETHLLLLQPGEQGDPVEVEIIHESLDNDTGYEALSYAWGDPTITTNIKIRDRKAKRYPYNWPLESALRHLRGRYDSRLIWADAICINQRDDTEKGHQVQNMSQVYRMSSRVCVWLGEAADDSDCAMDLINLFAEACQVNSRRLYRSTRSINADMSDHVDIITFQQLISEQHHAHCFVGLKHLILREWFRRLWTVQEIALAPLKDIFCGNKKAPWASLATLSRLFEKLWRTMVCNRIVSSDGSMVVPPATFGNSLRMRLEHQLNDWHIDYSDENAESLSKALEKRVYSCIRHRRLFTTESGRLGLAGKNLAVGDHVAILLGCTVPVILRSVPTIEKLQYTLIGESYIHEIMEGEAIEKLEAGQYELEDIKIV
ncbi:heterokaryon incompatibility protein-domain-containing protein [Leptodontidium sp. 2 PMI_412]|nr:heterokaryon incompatibility protein-domain-containing protein [Leptodontidium sp. 2 PMI_412]